MELQNLEFTQPKLDTLITAEAEAHVKNAIINYYHDKFFTHVLPITVKVYFGDDFSFDENWAFADEVCVKLIQNGSHRLINKYEKNYPMWSMDDLKKFME